MIPIYITCFNNGFMVERTVNALRKFAPNNNITILDNASTSIKTKIILDNLEKEENTTVIRYPNNSGPWRVLSDPEFEETRKSPFILTDPDLELEYLPVNTLEILSKIQEKYKVGKIGLALNISDKNDMFDGPYTGHGNIIAHESNFWKNRISDNDYELYWAEIDTTFCLFDYKYPMNRSIRIARNFTVRHLPWHKSYINSLPIDSIIEYFGPAKYSTISKLIMNYLKENGTIKQFKDFFVLYKTINQRFWDIYLTWEPETFKVFDKFADSNKNILDIGCWIGPTVLYTASKYNHIWALDADKQSFEECRNNINLNNYQNKITIINSAIYDKTGFVNFGRNKFLPNSRLNDSTSQIYENDSSESFSVPCISLEDLIKQYNIDNLALIKIDIEGGEQYIMRDLFTYSINNKIPLYLSFHYSWWNNKDLNILKEYESKFACGDVTDKVIREPFISILFEPL